MTESMGPITDHDFEHLAPERPDDHPHPPPTAARRPRAEERTPRCRPASTTPIIYINVRSGDFLADEKIGWREAYETQTRAALRPLAQAAE